MLVKNFSKSMLIKMVCGLQCSCDGPASSIMSPLAPKSGKLLISPNNTTPLLIVRQILLRSNIRNVQRTLWGNCKLKLHVRGKGLIKWQKLLCATQVVSDELSCKHSENVAESSLLIS